MDYSIFDCIDSGTENCPCYLAATGDCLVCSRLRGEDGCDCQWKGVCIYNEFIQGGRKINNPRRDMAAPIAEKKRYSEDLAVIAVDVGKGFALKASRPGSYVFLKAPGEPEFYHVPISVMKSSIEKGWLYLAIKSISAKTKRILEEEKELIIRGVYRNGILDVKHIMGDRGQIDKNKKILIITKGVGFAPAVLLARWAGSKASLDFWIDTDKIGNELILDYMPLRVGGTVKEIDLAGCFERAEKEADFCRSMAEGVYDTVLVLASDYYIEKIRQLTEKMEAPPRFACSNNFRICCGEGICGACSVVNSQGVNFKMCKCNHSPRE